MIAARQTFLGRGGARLPYVTDGLVSMWDGIWNAGVGIHDDNTLVWTDLVGGHDCHIPNISGAGEWTWRGFHYTATRVSAQKVFLNTDATTQSSLGANFTAEACVDLDSGWNQNYRGIFGRSGTVVAKTRGIEFQARRSGLNIGMADPDTVVRLGSSGWNGAVHTFSLVCDNGNVSVYADGLSRGSFTFANPTPNWNGICLGADYCASDDNFGSAEGYLRVMKGTFLRGALYTKTLSASEIAANYAVDIARFNLP